jgi:hypothetical protein
MNQILDLKINLISHPKKEVCYRFNCLDGWELLSHSILNKFAPRHSIFVQEMLRKNEEQIKLLEQRRRSVVKGKGFRRSKCIRNDRKASRDGVIP